MIRQTQGAGFKLAATAIIWGFATGMLGICIPLVSMTDSGVILPLAVIIGASFTTTVVWLSFNRVSRNTLELSNTIESLKEQEATLETIDNKEKFDDQTRIKLLEPRDNK
ncbi:MAG: hypothetical protein RID53_02465 [Coleofasciculus sp. B1-GNL1-01]|uniref:hypothetical protein n=1 Tax=Coleofasciculus sp. B1-GNL1-01 TaxID=3068484 RepID=UPI0032F444E2